MKYLLGYDVGSSSVKASLVCAETGKCVATDFLPKKEMPILSEQIGWAEQKPEMWWKYICKLTPQLLAVSNVKKEEVTAIGISYQMHGLVAVGKNKKTIRPAIIWCDSRAAKIGDVAEAHLKDRLTDNTLNSPGNFTASKLEWVKLNEKNAYKRIDKIMLPGDYVAMQLTGESSTTISGLSEGIFWDFKKNELSKELLDYYGFDKSIFPQIVPTFGVQGKVTAEAAKATGLKEGTPVTYRAGDQPNNAFSLNVLRPGEVASTAGTSGVVYGVSDKLQSDSFSRVNTFAHVNYTPEIPRLGVLLCINGTGILNSWVRKNILSGKVSYLKMNELAAQVPVGCEGVSILPFGNGVERIFSNKDLRSSMHGFYFNKHDSRHIIRAAQEGIAFAFKYGMDIMHQIGINIQVIKAGEANMFLSPIFRETLATVTGATIEMYDTDGSVGAARGAGMGVGIYKTPEEAFESLTMIRRIEPNLQTKEATLEAYSQWNNIINEQIGYKI